MRTNYVLIDFENVCPTSLASLEADCFKVVVFVGANQGRIPFGMVSAMQQLGQRGAYVKIAGNGPNALDFHIAYYIGRLAVSEPSSFFHVISRDTGFDPLIRHLKEAGIFAMRSAEIEAIPLLRDSKMSAQAYRQVVVARLENPKATRPRTLKALANVIASLFPERLPDEVIAKLIADLQKKGLVVIDGDAVSYVSSADLLTTA